MRTKIFQTGSVMTAILKNPFVLPQFLPKHKRSGHQYMGKKKYPGHANHLFVHQGGEVKTDVLHHRSRNVDENGDSILGICR